MAQYKCLYKCRLCGQTFTNCSAFGTKTAQHSTLNVALQASGLSPMWNRDDNLTMYEMHCCADGNFGISEFIGSKKVSDDGN